MKFLLAAVNAKYIHSNPAVYSLKAYAEDRLPDWRGERTENRTAEAIERPAKHKIEIAEYTINQRMEDILADVYKRQADVAAFSCYIWNIEMIGQVITELHKLCPELPIWLGGPEVSYEPELALKRFPFLAGIMVGEGERTFVSLLWCYGTAAGKVTDMRDFAAQLEQIPGLYLPKRIMNEARLTDGNRIGGKWTDGNRTGIYTGDVSPLSLDEMPFLYRDMEAFENRIVYYESSRGCPFRCSYCLSSIDKTVRLRSLERVRQELQFFLDRRVPQVKFIDRTFNCNHEHAMGIWEYIKEHDNGVTNFHFEIAADILREEELSLLNGMRPGLVQLEIGVQTTNQHTLAAIDRRMDMQRFCKIVERLRQGNNIHIHLDLIAGLPFEDFASFENSFNEVYAMEPEQLQLGFLKVLKGSRMYYEAKQHGICYRELPPYEVLYTKWLSYKEVLKLKQIEEMVELYYNNNQFTHMLPVLCAAFASPFEMFARLAEYYEENGYFTAAPARSYRYHVLLAFAEKQDAGHALLYRELCTFDMYLRENLKSRPDFAADVQEAYDKIHNFYKKPENIMTYLSEYRDMPAKQIMKMTHMEPFAYPVWDTEACKQFSGCTQPISDLTTENPVGNGENKRYYVLFDYARRNPLNHDSVYFPLEF